MFHPRVSCHGGLVRSLRKPLPESESVLSLCHPPTLVVLSKQGLWDRTTMSITQEAGWKVCPQVTAASTQRMGPFGSRLLYRGKAGAQNKKTKTYARGFSLPSQVCPSPVLLHMPYPPPSLGSPDLCYHYQTPGNIKLHEGSHLIHFCTLNRQEQCLGHGRYSIIV